MKDLHVNDQVKFLTDCVINVFNNFVPHKTIICKDKNPPWMNNEIKCAYVLRKKKFIEIKYSLYYKST